MFVCLSLSRPSRTTLEQLIGRVSHSTCELVAFFAVFTVAILTVMGSTFYYPKNKKEVSSNWKSLIASGAIKGVGKRRKKNEKEEKKSDASKEQVELVKSKSFSGLTKAVAMDCEMVGVGDKGEQSIIARVSIVNQFGHCLYDKYVKPTEKVTDYRTAVSGIRPQDIENGEDFKKVQYEVYEILKGRILVGHALKNDLKVLFIDHPKKNIRDTSRYFRKIVHSGRPSLKRLTSEVLNVKIQTGEHDSVQDAQAAMRLYTMYKKKWEKELALKRQVKKKAD